MTTQKHLKARVRSRMAKTGERYAAARAHVVGHAAAIRRADHETVGGIRHFPGIHPETTVLRVLATHAGIRDAQGNPPSEEQMLAVGGGPGAGVFAFHYQKEAFSSLYLAGRHRWEDPPAFVDDALRRLGLEPAVRQTGSRKTAERDLREALESGGPVAAFVDHAELGTRGAPPEASGGAYHVVAVYAIDRETAIIGDLAARAVEVPLDALARARARIAKYRNRLVSVGAASATVDLERAGAEGLRAGAEALASEPRRNFSLAAFEDLATRMTATTGTNSWASIFPRGRLLWTGLEALHRYVETYGTGGGLLRPILARAASGLPGLDEVGARYAELGKAWTELATAALPEEVPLLAETRRLHEAVERRYLERGAEAAEENRRDLARLDAIGREIESAFPMSASEVRELLADLSARLRAIHAAEVDALERLRAATA